MFILLLYLLNSNYSHRLFPIVGRVIIKLDSGPGQNNIDVLAYMRGIGVYCYPGVPNTTNVSQENDKNYSLFNSDFCSNLEILSQARFDIQKTLLISDLPLLVFGGKDEGCTDDVVQDCFSAAFSVEANLKFWENVDLSH